jgi:transmembrane sensor
MSAPRLARYFEAKATEARVARVWAGLDARFDRAERLRPLRRTVIVLALAAALAAALLVAWRRPPASAPVASVHVLDLADGSRVTHAADDRVEVVSVADDRVELRLVSGKAAFRVARNEARAFLTRAGGYTIRVVGTEYTVELTRDALKVAVQKGEVAVSRDEEDGVTRVRAGEAWSTSLVAAPETAPKPSPSPPATGPEPEATADGSASSAARPPARPDGSAAPESQAASALFQRAENARLAGRNDDAARLLGEFLRRYPNDPRAGLAAFELGRIRLDARDPKGAIEALDQAEGAGKAFEERVAARRVQALEESGDVQACRAERDAFLRRFPNGAFAATVRRRCVE